MVFKVFVHIVTYNHESVVKHSLASLLNQRDFLLGETLRIEVTDNQSTDCTISVIRGLESYPNIKLNVNKENLGFSAAHNQAISRFIESDSDYFLVLNPDLVLEPDALNKMIEASNATDSNCVTPLLLRADESLNPVVPNLVDAAGMYITPDFRHFDRDSNKPLSGCDYKEFEEVLGGTGACLLFNKSFVQNLKLERTRREEDLFRIYPQLKPGANDRVQLFDEAFFAYREDADLAMRAIRLGERCVFASKARGYHLRHVLPEKRSELSGVINMLGIKNRFLLQFNHCALFRWYGSFFRGAIVRNLVVVTAVLLLERRSLIGIRQACILYQRARNIFDQLQEREVKSIDLRKYFSFTPYRKEVTNHE